MNEQKRPPARTNVFRVLAGGYLLYLAYQLLRSLVQGGAENPAVNIGGGAVFLAVGGWLLWREWKVYRYAVEHKDDPSTWSDEPAPPAEALEEDPEELEDLEELEDPEGPDAPEDGEEEVP